LSPVMSWRYQGEGGLSGVGLILVRGAVMHSWRGFVSDWFHTAILDRVPSLLLPAALRTFPFCCGRLIPSFFDLEGPVFTEACGSFPGIPSSSGALLFL